MGAAFPSRKEKREPPPFSNLAPWEEGDGGEEGGELGAEEVWSGTGETVVERVERKGKRRWSGVSGKSLFGGKGREKSGAVELGGGGARGERGQAP